MAIFDLNSSLLLLLNVLFYRYRLEPKQFQTLSLPSVAVNFSQNIDKPRFDPAKETWIIEQPTRFWQNV